jgi:hypothetical protein
MKRLFRGLALIVILALHLMTTAPPHAEAQSYTLKVRFSRPPRNGVLCLGFPYEIQADTYASGYVASDAPDRLVPSFVHHEQTDVGIIQPVRNRSDYVRPATFNFIPTSTGEYNLFFSSQAGPPSLTQVPRSYARGVLEIDVKRCKYTAEMIYDLRWDVGSDSMVIGTGIMDEVTVEPDEDGNLHGEGALVYNQIITGFPECALSWTSLTSDVTITGQADGDQIDLNFAFGDASVTGTAICPEATVSGTQNLNPGSGFASSLTFPSEGGVMTYPSPNPVGGTVYVIVTHEEDEQAASDAGSQALAALSAWFAAWPGALSGIE